MSGIAATIIETDKVLATWAGAAEELCSSASARSVLRHLPNRRLTMLVEMPVGLAVLKVFASPRARGNVRRLGVFASTAAAAVVPAVIACDASGHVELIEFVAGRSLLEVSPDDVVHACATAGRQLRVIHECGARLDRAWTYGDECAQLRRTAGPRSADLVERVIRESFDFVDSGEPPVSSHRDCHPAQAVVDPDGRVRWIDLDDAAMAPASLDVGNFLAHLTRQVALGRWTTCLALGARDAFTAGYGPLPPAVAAWERLALARLVALADTRHDAPSEIQTLVELIG